MMMTPRLFAMDFIRQWEDGGRSDAAHTHSLDPVDAGNWSLGQRGRGKLIGSNHGVTAQALAAYRHVPVDRITRDVMHDLTIDEAAAIAVELYYKHPGLDVLPWNRVTMSVTDMSWGAGPTTAVKLLQRLCGTSDDGCPGPGTAKAVKAWYDKLGEEQAAREYAAARKGYYARIIQKNPPNAKYLNGWLNRTNYYLPGDGWWKRAG